MDRPTCRICGTTVSLLRCAKCKTVYYCSTSHQHMDWPNHKPECRYLAKQRIYQQQQQLLEQQQQQQQNNNRLSQMTTTNGGGAGTDYIGNNEYVGAGYNDWGGLFYDDILGDCGGMPMANFGDIQVDEANLLSDDIVDTLAMVLGTSEAEIMNNQAEMISQSQHSNLLFDNTMTSLIGGVGEGIVDGGGGVYGGGSLGDGFSSGVSHGGSDNNISPAYSVGRGDENYFLQPDMGGNTNERNDELCRNIINDMNTYGLSVVDDFLGMEKGLTILNEVHGMYAAGVFKDGQLASSNTMAEQDLTRTIRGDKTTWVTGAEAGCANVGYLINQIDAVITRANTMKNNGQLGNYTIRERTKAMVACYPGSGAHYVMHVDNPNEDGRVITAIYYLNVNWDTIRSGGVLRICPEHSGSIAEIEPKFDRLIFFWSDKRNPHEVQPAHRTRYAITVWYFDAAEREAALHRCKHGRNRATTKTTTNSLLKTPTSTITSTTNSNSSDICT